MGILVALCTIVLLGVVVLIVTAPLRAHSAVRDEHEAQPVEEDDAASAEGTVRRDELEAAREAKYREIRDAEMDFRTGKLSEDDYRALDAELRAEALVILDALDGLEPGAGESGED
jgi:hypothetical protein